MYSLQVKEKHIYWGLDKECPRVEALIEAIAEVAPKKRPSVPADGQMGKDNPTLSEKNKAALKSTKRRIKS